MQLVNLTPDIVMLMGHKIPPSGKVAFVFHHMIQEGDCSPVIFKTEVLDLPPQSNKYAYIVSKDVARLSSDRKDILTVIETIILDEKNPKKNKIIWNVKNGPVV